MEDLEAAIKTLVEDRLPGSTVEFDHDPGYEKLIGTVIWEDFSGMRQADRQHKLWEAIRGDLAPDQLENIGLLLTVTPSELHAILDDAA